MSKPATKALAILEMLQNQRQISGAELAERVGIDRRSLRRYIAALEELGIPITSERGRYGGYMLVPGFKLPPLMFTNEEAAAVALGLLAVRSLRLADTAPAVASAQAKLERVMPPALQSGVQALRATAVLETPEPYWAGHGVTRPALTGELTALALAAQTQHRVRFEYRPPAGEAVWRAFDPYGLVFSHGRWYTIGMCRLRLALRSFRLDRIGLVQETGEAFERPNDFDAAEHLAHSMATLPRPLTLSVLLHTDHATAVRELGRQVGTLTPQEGGGVLLQASTTSYAWFARLLGSTTFDFTVREPQALRQALLDEAARLQRLASRA
ncbi:YafY family protein [Massilia sp. NR 4-1]|uniref:helix-turn-helix transcriptional regulator n=1 Tax=Massilia sp. NR 4-1 TaxID=1678028 RepID=UPI00067CB162|nr:YafY family protein [Massilia sp. NR 4-1]AKU22277.1 transcriptional regulator [Massilia sp. NR 4-1]